MEKSISIYKILKYIYLSMCLLAFSKYFIADLPFLSAINYLAIFLPIIGILLIVFLDTHKLQYKNYIVLLFVIYAFATCVGNGNIRDEFIILIILIMLFKSEDPREFVKFILFFNTIFVILNCLLSYYGIFSFEVITGNRIRHYFNFFHPNSLGVYILSIYSLFCFNYQKNKPLIIIFGIVLFYFLYHYVDSRTSGLLILLILIIHVMYWISIYVIEKIGFKFENMKRVIRSIVVFVPLICLVLSIIVTLAYGKNIPLITNINKLLSSRISLQYKAYTNNGFPLFGIQKDFSVSGGDYNLVDSFYMQLIYRYGLIFEIILFIILTYRLYKIRNKYDVFSMCWIILVWSLHGFNEPVCLYFLFNPFLIYLYNDYHEVEYE